ncbi:hypothetical protein I6H96_02390 [Brucella anthropi]|uniref:Uncharacterized protein n=1 Tax=Brucella anthropi (strain ATCC 49188 / DSM 6882 / CCUG 24695 / JCM 21032 / LMG 3331 / NBRC 15819 / NCTC 12168 / Alc 37) TaxID=439375 RepID=A6WZ06_BRUA4|nr:hypothetical protein [Brucella anthropi]ABS14210.1 hypothetical protein Oant_1493 [Brucella anthropi ATCC 49188]QQC25732.1 hypothetical protein I6H96_02390 [Brucella anthropi]SUA65605.1 Uncharacterised protein [Brucella anthropi]
MKNFGKFIATSEIIDIPGIKIGEDENGEPIFGSPTKQSVLIFRDRNGKDWFDLAKKFPHPFYIAVDGQGRIVSMTDDFQQSQISGYDIIGIDQNYGFTFGPGGNVYGMLWTGIEIINPVDVMSSEEKRSQMPNLSQRQLRLGLNYLGKLNAVKAAIAALPDEDRTEAEIEWDFASEFRRLHPLIVQLIPILGLTDEEVDPVWMAFSKA